MYMLQIDRVRPIESISLRNGLFWEHRQLSRPEMLCTPSIDHIDLFSADDESFRETLDKIGKRLTPCKTGFSLHYLFDAIRSREFLLLPLQLDDIWVTVIARIQQKQEQEFNQMGDFSADMKVTDLALVDPLPEGREARAALINSRLESIFPEGCIESALNLKVHNLGVPDIITDCTSNGHWQTGLIAYAVSREFIRRLKVLQHRQDRRDGTCGDQDFLWAPFEEQYNFDTYRQSLLAACAHQFIEGSGFKARLALEISGEDANYQRELLSGDRTNILANDEKWDIFQTKTHTHAIPIYYNPSRRNACRPPSVTVENEEDDNTAMSIPLHSPQVEVTEEERAATPNRSGAPTPDTLNRTQEPRSGDRPEENGDQRKRSRVDDDDEAVPSPKRAKQVENSGNDA
ncbi:hypothetical protein F5B22DRAFT_595937 [Xylaria bambusicola]|uniref:uncharacterized protein n=1 Tax=Xylaria bambusicola TaxID=326684 RepID=UPI0020080215|nr:uncharacterized protein F5B22DRAFT_595937 [Xylaria bambusicola]KAI0521709.1 hypothetical protein F5B22DRAFT_595937 [Xylaria bambusicola]